MLSLLLSAALVSSQANPLIGRWIADRTPSIDNMNLARMPTMTITRDMIAFGQQGRIVGTERIDRFDSGDSGIAATTRFGEVYRFRFAGADRMCRVPAEHGLDGLLVRRPDEAQCWRRAPHRDGAYKASL